MPELPEVETIVQGLRQESLIGIKIKDAIVFWEKSIANLKSSLFVNRIIGQTILDITRRGKFLVFKLDQDVLLVHLRMTGKFIIEKKDVAIDSHERVRLYLSNQYILRYEDQRKFGKWYLVNDPQIIFNKIGIEPLSRDFTLELFNKLLKKGNRSIKPFLLDQKHIAGLGNIYVDEALWEAKIHPLRLIHTLDQNEKEWLHCAIILVLNRGIENAGTSLGTTRSNYFSSSKKRGHNQHALKVFRRDGLPCCRCQEIIRKIIVGQRGTHFCPLCQQQPHKN